MGVDSTILYVGLDDTDSPRAYCTTYATFSSIREMVSRFRVRFLDYPLLVRLNPNIPWKTRGNGANALKVEVETSDLVPIKITIINSVTKTSDLEHEKTDPSIIFLTKPSSQIRDEIRSFYESALHEVLNPEDALAICEKAGADVVFLKQSNNRGAVGALAALGALSHEDDFTYELILYRKRDRWGQLRLVDPSSVKSMDEATRPSTFNSYDYDQKRVLITPRGPDPVLAGIRGEDPGTLIKAVDMLRFGENFEGWLIFRTNQGTDAHLPKGPTNSREIMLHRPVMISGYVSGKTRTIGGGHVIAQITDRTGTVDVVAYEQSGKLRDVVNKLMESDFVEVYGNPKIFGNHVSINMEKLVVKELAPRRVKVIPVCPFCKRKTTSKGRGQGYECEICGFHADKPGFIEVKANIEPGVYLPPPRSQRHLTKPFTRYGRERKGFEEIELFRPWYSFNSIVLT